MSNKLNTRIGILGGGQLGKMLIESLSPLNLNYTVLESSSDCPAALVCNHVIEGSLYSEDAIRALAASSDVLTYEIEHVDVQTLKSLEGEKVVIPHPSLLEIIQDKGLQKNFYRDTGVPTLDYSLATNDNLAQKIEAWEDDQFVLKHRKGGYDGRGVQLLDKSDFLKKHEQKDPSIQSPDGFVIEKICIDAIEISVIVAVGQDGSVTTYEASQMHFDPEANLMDYLFAPSELDHETSKQCKEIAIKAVSAFNSPGIFAVELFVDDSKRVFVNEIAPRPHNSGHHTIESCYTSQYEQLNRILLNLPLGSTKMLCSALTANILGPKSVHGPYELHGLDAALQIPGVHIHLYGKQDSKPFRKIGHYTILGESTADCIEKMERVRKHLQIKAKD